MRILVNFGHPDPAASRAGRRMADAAATVPDVTVNSLTGHYPDLRIDGARERELLAGHDVVVLQFPLYWYSSPAIIRSWLDETLSPGFAYGDGGDALNGKYLMVATTTGLPREEYAAGGKQQYSIEEFLRPYQQTAAFCGMRWLPPFVGWEVDGQSEAALDDLAAAYARALSDLFQSIPGPGA